MAKETVEGLMELGKHIQRKGGEAKAMEVIENHPGAGVVGLAVMLGMFVGKVEEEEAKQ